MCSRGHLQLNEAVAKDGTLFNDRLLVAMATISNVEAHDFLRVAM